MKRTATNERANETNDFSQWDWMDMDMDIWRRRTVEKEFRYVVAL